MNTGGRAPFVTRTACSSTYFSLNYVISRVNKTFKVSRTTRGEQALVCGGDVREVSHTCMPSIGTVFPLFSDEAEDTEPRRPRNTTSSLAIAVVSMLRMNNGFTYIRDIPGYLREQRPLALGITNVGNVSAGDGERF